MGLLDGKTAIVTGAARGIGKAIALKFASEGANIAFTDLVIDENAQNTAREIEAMGVKAKGYASNAAKWPADREGNVWLPWISRTPQYRSLGRYGTAGHLHPGDILGNERCLALHTQ